MNISFRFCQKLDGTLAVAVDKETFTLMKRTFSDVCEGEHKFYSGHTDREKEGEWRDVNTGDLMGWSNWYRGEPNGGELQQCSNIHVSYGTMADISCARRICPICRVKQRTKLQLAGVCNQSVCNARCMPLTHFPKNSHSNFIG